MRCSFFFACFFVGKTLDILENAAWGDDKNVEIQMQDEQIHFLIIETQSVWKFPHPVGDKAWKKIQQIWNRNMRGCIIEVNPEWLVWKLTCSFDILLILSRWLRYSLKKRGQQNKGILILNLDVQKTQKFMQVCLLMYCFSGIRRRIAFKRPLDLYFNSLIIQFLWFAWLQFRIKEKMYTKVVFDVFRWGCLEVIVSGWRQKNSLGEGFVWGNWVVRGNHGLRYCLHEKNWFYPLRLWKYWTVVKALRKSSWHFEV